jgi:hypothetical protein
MPANESSIKSAIEALETAESGLRWYIDMCPQFARECDDEALAEIDAALSALRAQQDTKDGERYRWLRDWLLQGRERFEIMPEGHYRFYTTAEVDAAIDAARGADRG